MNNLGGSLVNSIEYGDGEITQGPSARIQDLNSVVEMLCPQGAEFVVNIQGLGLPFDISVSFSENLEKILVGEIRFKSEMEVVRIPFKVREIHSHPYLLTDGLGKTQAEAFYEATERLQYKNAPCAITLKTAYPFSGQSTCLKFYGKSGDSLLVSLSMHMEL